MHRWGDDWFEKNGNDLYAAIDYIMRGWHKWGRIGTHGKEKYGCYDELTKVLTKRGWKYFKDVNIKEDEFATLQSKNQIEYHKASLYVNKPYSGKMYKLSTRGVDLLVTPNHNLYFAKGDINGGKNNKGHKKFEFKLQKYKDFFQKPKKFTKGGVWVGESPKVFILPEYCGNKPSGTGQIPVHLEKTFPIEPWLALLGWITAEGCISDYQIDICLNNTDNGVEKSYVTNILNKLNIPFKTRYTNDKSAVVLKIYSVQLCNWLEKNIGKLAQNKKVPSFVKTLSPELIKIYLKNLYLGDGHKTKTAYQLSTTSEILAEDCLELLLKAGYCGRLSSRGPRQSTYNNRVIKGNFKEYTVNWLKNIYHHTSNSHDSKKSLEKKEKLQLYKGNVYCVEVPGHLLYVMRNGKPVWCGNTFRDHVYFYRGQWPVHELVKPGHVGYRWSRFFMHIENFLGRKIVQKLRLYKPVQWYQSLAYNYFIQQACKKWPNIVDELVRDLDGYELIKPGLFGKVCGKTIHKKYWITYN